MCFVIRFAYEWIPLQWNPERTTSGMCWSSPNSGCIPFNKNSLLILQTFQKIPNLHFQMSNEVVYGSMWKIFCRLYRDILTAYCWSSSDHCCWFIVIGVTQSLLMVGGFQSKALLALSEDKTVLSAARCTSDWLLCCLGIHSSEIIRSCSRKNAKSFHQPSLLRYLTTLTRNRWAHI